MKVLQGQKGKAENMKKKEGYVYIGDECYHITSYNGQSEVRKVFPSGYEVVYKGTYEGCQNYIADKYDNEEVYSI